MTYGLMAAGVLAAAVVALLFGALDALTGRKETRGCVRDVRASYGIADTSNDQEEQDRLKAIARAWCHANLHHIAIPGLGGLLALLASLTVFGVVAATVSPGWIVSHAAYAITLGTLALRSSPSA